MGTHRKPGGCMSMIAGVLLVIIAVIALTACGSEDEINGGPPSATNEHRIEVGGWELIFGCHGTTGIYVYPHKGVAASPQHPECTPR